ncbi:MAG TPA: hypothetical protein VNA14_13360 [Mycobacteriales bacterium]|nr:hypothetical protein [Mycobacteriales bacterium]
MRISRLPATAFALSAVATGIVLAGPSQAAPKPCVQYPDVAGDTAAQPPSPLPAAGSLPLADGDTDLTGVAIATVGDSLVGYVKVAALATRPTHAPGDWHEFGFSMGGKAVEVFVERVPAPLDAVVTAAFGYGGVEVDGEYTPDIATAKYDTASNTVEVSVKLADFEKAVGVPPKGAKLTKITGRTRMHYLALYSTMDTLAAPEAATYVIGTACAPPVAAAAPAPAPAGSASADPSPSASAAPSASASAAPSGSAAPRPSATASPKPSATAAPKRNPGCATASSAPKPTASGTASSAPSASTDPSASESAGASAPASATPAESASADPSASASASTSTSNNNTSATGVTLRISATEVTACNTPQLSGQVTDVQGRAVPDAEVSLFAKAYNARSYTSFATVRTNSTGQYLLSVRPTVHTTYGAVVGSAKSPTVSVQVRTRVVIESPRADTAVRNPITLRGRLVPGHGGAAVELGYAQNGRYVVLGRASTDSQGYYVVSGRPARGRHTFVVSTAGRTSNLAGRQPITLTVQ